MSYMAGITSEIEPSKIKAVRTPARPRSSLKPSTQQATSPIAQGDKNRESAVPSSQSNSSEDDFVYAAPKAVAFNARRIWSNVFLVSYCTDAYLRGAIGSNTMQI